MKRFGLLALVLLLVHAWGLRICFFPELDRAHAHASDHAHEDDTSPESKPHRNFHCTETSNSMAFSGGRAGISNDNVLMVLLPYEAFPNNVVMPKVSVPKSPLPPSAGLPPYLVLSVLRI